MIELNREWLRRGLVLTGAAALLALSGSAVAQVGVEREVVEQGTAKAPAPIFTIAPDEKLDGTTLYLAVGRIDTSEAKTTESLADAIRNAAPDDRHVIQLDGPMTPERREQLSNAGFELLDYLPTNAYVTRFSTVDPAKAQGLDFIRWHNTYESLWKTNPEIGTRQYQTQERLDYQNAGQYVLNIALFRDADLPAALDAINAIDPDSEHFLTQLVGDQRVVNVAVARGVLDMLADIPEVQYIDAAPEITQRNATSSWVVQSNQPNNFSIHDRGLTGEGQIVAVADGRIDINHCAFEDPNVAVPGPTHRKIIAFNTDLSFFDFHGTHVAGTVAGDDGSAGDNRGVAYQAKIVFDDEPSFDDNPMYNMLQVHHNQGARIHTNSWGQDGTTQYTGLTRGIDRFSYDFEESLVIFASTNQNTLFTPENAKNVLAVGGTLDVPSQDQHCTGGIGPTNDGRRKPEIYAPGCGILSASVGTDCSLRSLSGTSMATPAIAGAAVLTRQYFTEGWYPSGMENPSDARTPSGALIKATLLNGTVDMTGVSGFPSNLEGWGRLVLDNALFFSGESRRLQVEDVRNADGLETGQIIEYTVNVASGDEPLNITAVWTEPPAAVGTSAATINDLDLEAVSPSGVLYRGNFFSGGTSVPNGTADDKNNVESVRLSNPESGSWTVRLVGSSVNVGKQGFGVAINGDLGEPFSAVSVSLDAPLPDTMLAGETIGLGLSLDEGDDTLVPGSLKLFVADDGVNFTERTLTQTSGATYEATIGPFECADTPQIFVEVEGVVSGERQVAGAAKTNPHEIAIGELFIAIEDDFELDRGWTVNPGGTDTASTGAWERATPQPTAAQPGSDTTPDDGTIAYVTGASAGAGAGSFDIDGGTTTLVSPQIDLSGLTSATIAYNRWYSNSGGAAANQDVFRVQISDNDGATWTALETVGPTGPGVDGGWIPVSFKAEDFVSLTSTVRVRFIAADEGSPSLVEAAIDDFRIDDFACVDVPVSTCTADLDGNRTVDLDDFSIFIAQFGNGSDVCIDGCTADLDGNDSVNLDDFSIFIAQFGNIDDDCD